MTNILRNPFFAGIMRWNGQERVGKFEPIITPEEHRQVLTIMDVHNYHACRRRTHNFLLRGFVFCYICGQRFTADRHRAGKISDYYHCSARSIQHSNKKQNIETGVLEKKVEELFKNIQFSQEFIDLTVQKVKKFYEEKRKEVELQKRTLLNRKMSIEEKRRIAEEKLIAGTLTDDDFVRMRERFKDELNNVQGATNELENQHDIDIDTTREVLMLSRNVYEAYKKAHYEIKRLYLGFFWDKIWVKNKKIVRAKPTELIEALVKEKKIFATQLSTNASLRGGVKPDFRLTPNWLPGWDDFRTLKWLGLVQNPKIWLKQARELLVLTKSN